MSDYLRLRQTFTEDAARYDRRRPGYPSQIFDDLAAAGVGPGARVLEIGCGTGQATVPLAERGCQVTAVELGAEMAAMARQRLSPYRNVRVETAAFEDWPLPAGGFDAVIAATSFHWIDPAVRLTKSAGALRPGGVLATVATHHVLGGTVDFFAAAQGCYERFDPDTPPGLRLEPAGAIPRDEIDAPWFSPPTFHRYEWDHPYTTDEYIDLLMTYSGHRALAEDRRTALLTCIAGLIDTRFGGRIVKRYLTELRLTHRVA